MTTRPRPSDPVSAFTRADGTTEAHSTDHGRVIGVWENVKHHGATGNGTTDDTTAIQAAITALSTSGGTLFFPQGTYKITSAITLPATASSPAAHTRWHIIGHGATIKATTAITMLKSVTPADNSAAVSQSNCQYTIEGLSFLGSSTAGQKGLQLIATYGSVVRDCVFRALDYGIDGIFAINTRIEECFFIDMAVTDIMIRSATYGPSQPIWVGASNDFTASNNCYITNCRHYQANNQTRTVDIGGTAQCVIDGCVYEGGTPLTSVYYTGNGSTNARTFTMRNCWFESGGAATYKCIEIPNFIELKLERIRFLAGSLSTDIDFTGITSGVVHMYDCEFVATDPKIKQTSASQPLWSVLNNNPTDLFTNAAYWSSAQPNHFQHVSVSSNACVVEGNQIILRSTGDSVYLRSDTGSTSQSIEANNVVVKGRIRAAGSAAGSTPGTVVKKLLIQDSTGSDLGYIAIYDAIT